MNTIELIYDSDCPNVAETRRRLSIALTEAGLPIRWREWERSDPATPSYARQCGSPTILVDGGDLDPQAAAPESACCRIYRGAVGSLDGVPDTAMIRRALEAATSHNHSKIQSEKTMALKQGEKYRCPDPECGCEIEVTRGAAPGKGGDMAPRCCCGRDMQKVEG